MESGYIVKVRDTDGSCRLGVCVEVLFGQRPVVVRMLETDRKVRVAMRDVVLVSKTVPNRYSQGGFIAH